MHICARVAQQQSRTRIGECDIYKKERDALRDVEI